MHQEAKLKELLKKLSCNNLEELLANDYLHKPGHYLLSVMSKELIKDTTLQIYEQLTQGRGCALAERLKSNLSSTALSMESYFQKSSKKHWFGGLIPQKVYEVTGKAASGKTHFCQQLIVECLTSKLKVYCFDSQNNFSAGKLQRLLEGITGPCPVVMKLQSMKKLMVMLHCLGKELIADGTQAVIVIDCLSYAAGLMEHEKHGHYLSQLKKLFSQIVNKSNTTVVYTTMSKANLYETAHQKTNEPRFRSSLPRAWDSLSDSTIVLDSPVVFDEPNTLKLKVYRRLCFPKSLDSDPIHVLETQPFR